jgi:hypothetical protein
MITNGYKCKIEECLLISHSLGTVSCKINHYSPLWWKWSLKKHSPKIVITGHGLQVNDKPGLLGWDRINSCLTMGHVYINNEDLNTTLVRLHLIISMRNRCNIFEFCKIDMCRKCVFSCRLCQISSDALDLNKRRKNLVFSFLAK